MDYFPVDHVVAWRSVLETSPAHGVAHVGYMATMIVVEDSPSLTVLLQAAGSPVKRRSGLRGGPDPARPMMLPGGWDGGYEDRTWTKNTVRAHSWARGYSIIRDWNSGEQAHEGWYVNLEAPWVRTSLGFDTKDLVLDVTVSDDLAEHAFKDEDEFAWARANGLLTETEVALGREQALLAIDDLRDRRELFDEALWRRWVPRLPAVPPSLPSGWAELAP